MTRVHLVLPLIVMGMILQGCASEGGSKSTGATTEATCEPEQTTLFAGQSIASGSVSVTNTANALVISVDGTGDWKIGAVHLYAGTDPVPLNSAGEPAPGAFPHEQTFDPPCPARS